MPDDIFYPASIFNTWKTKMIPANHFMAARLRRNHFSCIFSIRLQPPVSQLVFIFRLFFAENFHIQLHTFSSHFNRNEILKIIFTSLPANIKSSYAVQGYRINERLIT